MSASTFMNEFDESELQAKREYAQLLRLHDRLLVQMQRVLEDLTSTQAEALLKDIRARTGGAPDLTEIQEGVEESIRALKLSQSKIRSQVFDHRLDAQVDGLPDLPPHLRRFLAERAQSPGFTHQVLQDEIRGWVVRWKEYTPQGTIRAFGQFYERPYAYLDD